MSEPSSLYMRVTLTEDSYTAFLSSPLIAPREYADWLDWLKTRHYSGDEITASDIARIEPPKAADLAAQTKLFASMQMQTATPAVTDPVTVGAYLSLLLNTPFYGPTRAHYDAISNRWILIIAQCSENILEYVELLAILRAAARYKDLSGDDFILIFPYLWGGPPDAYVSFEQGSSRLSAIASDRAVEEAGLALETRIREVYPDGDDVARL